MIKSWSYSKLIDFEQCKLRTKLKYVDHIPENKAPAAERGTEIHQLAEDFVAGRIKVLPSELRKFDLEFETLKAEYSAKRVSLEGEWGFDKDWLPTAYKTAWLRMKADAVYFLHTKHAVVIDYKTGKRYGNELKHGEQVQLYAIATFIRNPDLEQITVELWYLDIDELHGQTYTRPEALRYVQPFDRRATKLTTCTEFPPNPNLFTCKWCPYGPAKGGQCEYGTVPGQSPIQLYRRKFG